MTLNKELSKNDAANWNQVFPFMQNSKFKDLWIEFRANRKSKNKPMSKDQEIRQLRKAYDIFEAVGKNTDLLIQHMNKVCDNDWINIYVNPEHLDDEIKKLKGEKINHGKGKFSTDTQYQSALSALAQQAEKFDFVGAIKSYC